jgi:hypothetical protein
VVPRSLFVVVHLNNEIIDLRNRSNRQAPPPADKGTSYDARLFHKMSKYMGMEPLRSFILHQFKLRIALYGDNFQRF